MAKNPDSPQGLDLDAIEAKQLEGISDWVSKNLGGEVREITRLERWRPLWKVEYSDSGKDKTVLVRGDRPISQVYSLKYEMQVMQALEANGVKVPHIYGWMDSPTAFVMEWIETEDRDPGMLHTAIENPTTMSDERWQAMLSYMDHLAEVHKVPVDEFTHIEGLIQPKTAREIALNSVERMYEAGVEAGLVDSALEFLQSWLRRNVPEHRTQASFATGDAGQFMSAGSEVLALLDFEIAFIGDIHWDLACFRGRHPYENMGDIPALYRRYAEASGTEVDLPVVCYHTVAFLQFAAIAAMFFTEPDARGSNWIEGILEYASIARRAYEAIAELQGIELDHDLHLPEPDVHPLEASGLNKLLIDIERLPTSSAFEPWERDLLGAIPQFLLNHARYRRWFEAEAVADINRITGKAFDDLSSADVAVTELIAADDPSRDEELVRIMHRRILRLSMIIAGTDPSDENPLFYKLDPILS
ncbi:MAG: phosphotransferase [Deltaproteobacteria bacterium]|jgi:aminoglycoside phosphotransferase (APT) family kinase protein|nr:phosphotransferase [Deltaproteobacteria bacterium]